MNYTNYVSSLLLAVAVCLTAGSAVTQTGGSGTATPNQQGSSKPTIVDASESIQKQLAESLAELSALREQIGGERLPMAKQLTKLERQLAAKRKEFDTVGAELADKTQGLSNLSNQLEALRAESGYVSNLLTQYGNEFASRLHIVELQRYDEKLKAARLAMEDSRLSDGDKFSQQLGIVATSLDKIEDAIGGVRFEGNAVAGGVVKPGRFVLLGPTALFASADSEDVGAAEERIGSQQPTVIPYSQEGDRAAAAALAIGTGGSFPIDVTLGNAQKVESIDETWWEHVQKGGVIMIPMAVLAGSALLVVLIKWLSMVFVRRPTKKQVGALLECIDSNDHDGALECAAAMPGPAGRMLEAGMQHLGEPRDLVEEVMFEKMLSSRLRLQAWLPFVAICATSAPLLGLLGTVTGIMGTFALMTEFGTGDPKVLSSGISEALITTENGLIIAIPSLLLHAFLSRKARALVDGMEKMALQVLNRVRSTKPNPVAA
ncbi:MAG: biopolymer transport protein ExbB [Planctomycetota bacterium]|jgi:biopolymer transport protein ExbB